MNGANILSIVAPELLFSEGNKTTIEKEYKELAKRYHPDISKNNDGVFAHIGKLHQEAIKHVEQGIWEIPGIFVFKNTAGVKYQIKYKYRAPFEFGRMYGGDSILAYLIDKQYKDFYINAKRRIKNLTYASDRMRKEFERCLPTIKYEGMTEDHYVLVISKTPDVVPLRGLQLMHKKGLDPKQVAWIMSSLHNMLCYLSWAGISHLNINLDTYFVSYHYHTGLLLGGWWYCTPIQDRIEYVPRHTIKLMSSKSRETKKATHHIDTELIKSIGRELMGTYMSKKEYPELEPMINWLLLPANKNPRKQFQSWGKVLKQTFGLRKFVKLEASNEEIYATLQ